MFIEVKKEKDLYGRALGISQYFLTDDFKIRLSKDQSCKLQHIQFDKHPLFLIEYPNISRKEPVSLMLQENILDLGPFENFTLIDKIKKEPLYWVFSLPPSYLYDASHSGLTAWKLPPQKGEKAVVEYANDYFCVIQGASKNNAILALKSLRFSVT
jgi:hypothetical protein